MSMRISSPFKPVTWIQPAERARHLLRGPDVIANVSQMLSSLLPLGNQSDVRVCKAAWHDQITNRL